MELHPDASCQNGNCKRTWKCALIAQEGRQLHLCNDCADYFLHSVRGKGEKETKFLLNSHKN